MTVDDTTNNHDGILAPRPVRADSLPVFEQASHVRVGYSQIFVTVGWIAGCVLAVAASFILGFLTGGMIL